MTLLDPSAAMLDKAQQRLGRLPAEAQRRVTLLQADGEKADEAVDGRRFVAVLCHGVLGYLKQPEPLVDQLCRCAAGGGIVSIMTGNAKAMAVRPALERRWDDALAAFVLGSLEFVGPSRSAAGRRPGSNGLRRLVGVAAGLGVGLFVTA